MKTIGIDNLGRHWWIESDLAIEVKKCPSCGMPVAIINTSETETVEKVVFHTEGKVPGSLVHLGIFKVEELKGEAKTMPAPCPWCGFTEFVKINDEIGKKCPKCGAPGKSGGDHETKIRTYQGPLVTINDVGWKCWRCGYEWGFETPAGYISV